MEAETHLSFRKLFKRDGDSMELVVTSCPVVGMDKTSEWGTTGDGTAESIGIVATSAGKEKEGQKYLHTY
jgi:hypothetical protein